MQRVFKITVWIGVLEGPSDEKLSEKIKDNGGPVTID